MEKGREVGEGGKIVKFKGRCIEVVGWLVSGGGGRGWAERNKE